MQLDAAPTYAFRARARPGAPQAIGAAQPIGGVAPVAGADESGDGTAATMSGAVSPPPSIDGKGTLINTYA